MLVLGIITFRSNETFVDYILAGRKLGVWITALSERAAADSVWLLLIFPGIILSLGLMGLWTAVGCAVGVLLSWILIARRFRISSEANDAPTIPQYLENCLIDSSKSLRTVGAIIIIFFYVFFLCALMIGAGNILSITFGINETPAMILAAIMILAYTAMGGLTGIARIDFIQALLTLLILIVLPIAFIIDYGGWTKVITAISAAKIGHLSLLRDTTGICSILSIISGAAWGLGYMGQPHLLTRFMAIKNPDDLRTGTFISMIWSILALSGAMLVGLFAIALLSSNDPSGSINLIPLMAAQSLPAWLAALMIAGVLAAFITVGNSLLLAATSTIAEDIFHTHIYQDLAPTKLIRLSRFAAIIVGLIALGMAALSKGSVVSLVGLAWAGLGASFGPGLLLTLWWRRTTREGVLAGMIVGTMTVIIWHFTPQLGDIVYELAPGFVFALLAVWFVSLATYNKRRIH